MTTPVRRWASVMLIPALGLLTSCGIPTTGVVQSGVPASGLVPTIRVYYVTGDVLYGVSRRTAAPPDVGSAVQVLLKGPTPGEQSAGLRTLLPSVASPPTSLFPTEAPTLDQSSAAQTSKWVQITSRKDRVDIRLTVAMGGKTELAAAQLICTALAAERVGAPGSRPLPVTVTAAEGREIRSSDTACPD
ncbi:hypothetical protein [Streptomyces griseorubiginosus]|uniref:hypothetical protein n=1 Tax=Streptomyces griseorubiginosus TaxID=67304 RepID=UPI001AD69AB1|nr:hypothetical protein [Streptomyces griseorubiginosus]MBO4255166.1 hypothetical protein [Streptomyces griseorubiginosus]